MVSNQVLQKTIDELRAITRIDLCVMSLEGQKVASTFSEEGFEPEYVREFVKSPADSQVLQGYHFFKIYAVSYTHLDMIKSYIKQKFKIS